VHGPAVDQHLPAIGQVEARQDLHQRGFARAVFAKDAVDATVCKREGDVVVRVDWPEALVNMAYLNAHRVS